jgi:hypothetical protein
MMVAPLGALMGLIVTRSYTGEATELTEVDA